jgi:hypothetical protein
MLYELASALASHIDDSVIPRQPHCGFLAHLSRVLALTRAPRTPNGPRGWPRRPAIPASWCLRRGAYGGQQGCWPPGSRPSA